jgi:hypothetical protein
MRRAFAHTNFRKYLNIHVPESALNMYRKLQNNVEIVGKHVVDRDEGMCFWGTIERNKPFVDAMSLFRKRKQFLLKHSEHCRWYQKEKTWIENMDRYFANQNFE